MNPYQAPGSIAAIGAAPQTLLERARGRSMRWTAAFAMVTGVVFLGSALAVTYIRVANDLVPFGPDAQVTFQLFVAKLVESRPYGAAVHLAIVVAGASLWRGSRFALAIIALGCAFALYRLIDLGLQSPGMRTLPYVAPPCAWLAFVIYRTWKNHRQFPRADGNGP